MSNPRIPYRMSSERPALPAMDGKRILVNLVVNVENWQFDQPMPRTIITPPHGRETVPDVPNFSWADYGMRAGLPRFLKLFAERDLPASTSINAGVIAAYPQAAAAMRSAGWEFIGHGLHQRALNHSGAGEAELVAETIRLIRDFTDAPVRGWLSPGLRESLETPEILKQNGVDHVFDWVVDDLPSWIDTSEGPLMAMPYNLEINDSIVYAIEKHATGEMLNRLTRTLELFRAEASDNPRVLAIGLHPHLQGVPHRLQELVDMVDLLRSCDDVLFTTGSAIADWYATAEPAPGRVDGEA